MKMRLIVMVLVAMLMATVAEANATRGDLVKDFFQGLYDTYNPGGDGYVPPPVPLYPVHVGTYVKDPVLVVKPIDHWYRMHACMLLWLLPLGIIGMIPAFCDHVVYFDNAGEPVLVTGCYFGLWVILLLSIDKLGIVAIFAFWALTFAQVIWNISRTMRVNPRNPVWSVIIGVGKLPVAVLASFFIFVFTFGAYKGTAEEQLNAKVNDLIKAGALALLLRRLVNGDSVRERRLWYGPDNKRNMDGYGYSY